MDDPIFEKVTANGKGHGQGKGHNGHAHGPVPKARVLGSVSSYHNNNKALRDSSEPSDWSDVSAPEMIEMKHETQTKSRKSSRTSDYGSSASSITSPAQPESRLAYGLTFDRSHGRLYIRVIQLGNFRVTDPDGALSPYVKVRVYRTPRHFFTFKLKTVKELPLNQLEAEMQTRIQRRTDNPVFNEYFEMVVEDPDVAAYTVKFLVCDYDKFSRHVVVGEVTVELSKVDLSSAEEILFNDLIERHHEDNLGELHVALMYLPTAEKLSVSILNAKGLCALEAPKKHTDAVVKLVLMYDGRPLKKTKTSPKTNDSNPVFNETFVFDVPAYQLDKVYFHLAVIAIEKDREDGRHLLGRIYIGVNFDADAKAQWLEMVHNARKQVACWHRLQS
ncbi:synaptotagmin 47 [Elysia marginata]|uniref:Synaptotagmin 47 n=1 Tax=Elysia marginata TaxID=1093978 RepID=A0AAV4EXL4_9GAST|nr:synaptotagmin 47 [Elysia marginata]